MVLKYIKNFFGFTEFKPATPTPAPAVKEEVVVTKAPALDPVAVALDLEPMQITKTAEEPAKKTRKPRAPKAEKPAKAPKAKKPAKEKVPAMKAAKKPAKSKKA